MSALWINLFADELVSLLSAFGNFLGIPSSVLGITVLSWGNRYTYSHFIRTTAHVIRLLMSIGDLVSCVMIARKGFAETAVSASYSAPIFSTIDHHNKRASK